MAEPVALVAAALLVGFLLLTPGTPRRVSTFHHLVQLVAPLAAGIGAGAVARRERGPLRLSWAFLAMACLSWAGGQAVVAWTEGASDSSPSMPSPADVGFLGAIPLLLAGVASYPVASLRTVSRARIALDAGVIAVGTLMAYQAVFLGRRLHGGETWTPGDVVALAYPVADVVVLAIIGAIAMHRRDGQGPLPRLIAGMVAITIADAAHAYAVVGGDTLSARPTDAGWVIGFGCIGMAALRVGSDSSANNRHPVHALGGEHFVPAIAVVLAATVLGARAATGAPIGPFMTTTTVGLLALVALRQLAVQIENASLTRSLRDTVATLEEREDELEHRTLHDPLTGLANRELFRNRLEHALHRRPEQPLALAFIDIDDFKTVNDSLGFDAGDQLLKLVAERLRACIRPGDTVARLGGDEFAVLIEDGADADALSGRLLAAFAVPFAVGRRELQVDASVGVASGWSGRTTGQELLRDADLAMYAAKAAGKGRVEEFQPDMREGTVDRLDLLHDLDVAIERGELFLEYQAVQRIATGEIAGYEALLRWAHPRRGVLYPSSFLDLAEESGRMEGIGWWALETAFRAHRRLATNSSRAPWVSVNLSARELLAPSAPQALAHAVAVSGIDPGRVVLELTEGTLLSGPQVADRLAELKAFGVRLAVDDFGTGYSALSYLAQLPFDIVKIDRSFIQSLGRGGSEDILVAAIVQLASSLGIRTIAEGVELQSQLERLRELGCDGAQGWLIGLPTRLRTEGASPSQPVAHDG